MFDRTRTRREMLTDIGRGMFVAGLGAGVAADLGLAPAWAGDDPGAVTFGDLEPLVAFMQETPADKILPRAIEKIRAGTDLKQLVAAAALANARAFGGEDYVGFHTLMALVPAFHMSAEEKTEARKPLAVLKVLVRNAGRLQEAGAAKTAVLKPVKPGAPAKDRPGGDQLRDQVRNRDLAGAEGTFAALAGGSPEDALNTLMVMVDDAAEVHRVVLVSRSWDLLDFVGRERAHTMLRQSVHYCVKGEQSGYVKAFAQIRELLPKLLDQHKLLARPTGNRTADDAWVARLAETIFKGTPEQAAEAVAVALAEGFDPGSIGEAVSLAANQLVLRDEGRPKEWAQPNKPPGSVHGDSIGVHACDSVNAWRNIARAGDTRTRVSSLVLGAYQVARDRGVRGDLFAKWDPYPRPEHMEKVRGIPADALLKELGGAIREKDQGRAAAITQRLGEEKATPADVFAVLRDFAVSEDGALHAEKFYRTTVEDYTAARSAFRWRRVVALARVTASAYGYPAPGFKDACGLLKTS
ncbi:MAG: hypothetical protein JWO38_2667 [Gemmataceae bacterium]|nr:hypothetical protein [Gemmataceae bacterium]